MPNNKSRNKSRRQGDFDQSGQESFGKPGFQGEINENLVSDKKLMENLVEGFYFLPWCERLSASIHDRTYLNYLNLIFNCT